MIAVKSEELNPIEIYPQIFVYKNLFKDIENNYSSALNNFYKDKAY